MAFVGQLYASDRFPTGGHLALQFYVCNDCRETRPLVHMEALPYTSSPNVRRAGVRCLAQPKLSITLTAVEDSMDQWTFNRRRVTEDELPDKHLRRDKVGGLFPYDDYEGPKITRQNLMVAQFAWQEIKATVYLYHSSRLAFYPHLYS